MNLHQFILILRTRWRMVAMVVAAGLVLALLWVLLAPARYTAASQVLVDVRTSTTSTMSGDTGVTPQIQPDYLATQVDIIKSPRVARLVVDKLGILRDPEAMQSYRDANSKQDARDYFADQLADAIRVVPSLSSRVITILDTADSREAAAAVANAFAQAYREASVDIQRAPARQASLDLQSSIDETAKKLASSQAQLSAERQRYGITAVGTDGLDAEDARLTALAQQLAAAQATAAVAQQRPASGALPDTMLSPVIQGLQAQIAAAEAQRAQLASYAGPNNPQFREVDGRLAALKGELAQQKALVAQSAQVTSSQAAQSVGQLQAQLTAQRARVMTNQRARGDLAALQENVADLSKTYENLVAKQSESNVQGEADQSNVVLLSEAVPPEKRAGLPVPLIIVAGLLLGLFLGSIAAIVAEFLDQRLRQPSDIGTWLGIPDLGAVHMATLGAPPPGLLGAARRYLPGSTNWNEE